MSLILPVNQVSSWFGCSYELEGSTYEFEYRWNARIGVWVASLSDGAGNMLASGIKLVTSFTLLAGFRTLPGIPPGELILLDTQSLGADPLFDDLGRRHQLLYLLSTELP